MDYVIHQNKGVTAEELSGLLEAVGWGGDYPEELVVRSIAAYPFVAHARSSTGKLLGYISAFSDGAFSTMLGELIVHPDARRYGIGRSLLLAVEQAFPNVPVYAKPLPEAEAFFRACGYKSPAKEMRLLFKRNQGPAIMPVQPTTIRAYGTAGGG